MADRRPGRVVAALGPDQPVDILGQHGLQHLQAGPHGQSEQPSRAAPAGSATATVTCSGNWSWAWSVVAVRWVSFGTAVPFWSSSLVVARHLPHGRHYWTTLSAWTSHTRLV
jgi:hypothetical protein